MKALLEKAKELLTKELGREPTADEVMKYLNGSGLLMVNKILKAAAAPREVFEDYSNKDLE